MRSSRCSRAVSLLPAHLRIVPTLLQLELAWVPCCWCNGRTGVWKTSRGTCVLFVCSIVMRPFTTGGFGLEPSERQGYSSSEGLVREKRCTVQMQRVNLWIKSCSRRQNFRSLSHLICTCYPHVPRATVLPDFPDEDTLAYMAGMLSEGWSDDLEDGFLEFLEDYATDEARAFDQNYNPFPLLFSVRYSRTLRDRCNTTPPTMPPRYVAIRPRRAAHHPLWWLSRAKLALPRSTTTLVQIPLGATMDATSPHVSPYHTRYLEPMLTWPRWWLSDE
jgi:hypothetical protein